LHELSIAGAICSAAREHAGTREIVGMRIEVGTLSGVLADALDFCIREVARADGLGEPDIVIEEKSPVCLCACGREYDCEDILKGCPSCGGFDREVTAGMDVTIREIITQGPDT